MSPEARRKRQPEHPHIPEQASAEIIKALSPIASTGHRPDTIFEDWLVLSEATLDMLPTHLKSSLNTGQLAEDSPEAAETWTTMRQKYGEKTWVFVRFSEAFGLLLNAAYLPDETPTYQDVVGETFMQFGRPSAWAGQFFTPWTVAKFMALMDSDGGAEVQTRLKAAIDKSPVAQALAMAGMMLDGEETQKWLLTRVIPAALEHYEPVTVLDPAVGSGIMLLAHASTMPRWMVTTGLVQYYGCDIDLTCVRMTRLNFKLYGLNGHHLKYALDLTPEDLTKLPQPHAKAYAEAQQANGDSERVEEIARAVRGNQLSLFSDV